MDEVVRTVVARLTRGDISGGGELPVAGAGEVVRAGDGTGDGAGTPQAGHLHTELHGARGRALRDARAGEEH